MRPSATPHRSPADVTPKLLWASCQPCEISGQYIARSTTISTSDVTVVDTAAFRSCGATVSTLIVDRLLPGMTTFCGMVVPSSSRYRSETLAGALFGLLINTKQSKNDPVAPS